MKKFKLVGRLKEKFELVERFCLPCGLHSNPNRVAFDALLQESSGELSLQKKKDGNEILKIFFKI